MKITLIFLILFFFSHLTFVTGIYANEAPTTKEQLLEEFEKALVGKSEGAISTLFFWRDVKEKLKSSTLEMMMELSQEKMLNFNFKPLPSDFQSEYIFRGIRSRPNIPILGFIEVKHVPRNSSDGTSLPYGKDGSFYYLTSTVQEKVADANVNSVSLNVVILGNATYPNDDDFAGHCIYLQGDQEIKKEFEGNGNQSYAFWGNKIKSCEVRKTSGKSPIGLLVSENGKDIFKSEMRAAYEPIRYGES